MVTHTPHLIELGKIGWSDFGSLAPTASFQIPDVPIFTG
jgi:hypothetical protein